VARETYHSLEAVDRYLGQYDRVRHCRLQGLTPEQTAHALGCGLPLVAEYLAINDLLDGRGAGGDRPPGAGRDRPARGGLPAGSDPGYAGGTRAEDRATRGRDPSADPGAKTGMGGRTPPLGIPGLARKR
jgi:hypothetical protein